MPPGRPQIESASVIDGTKMLEFWICVPTVSGAYQAPPHEKIGGVFMGTEASVVGLPFESRAMIWLGVVEFELSAVTVTPPSSVAALM